jgi:hypothetical protein
MVLVRCHAQNLFASAVFFHFFFLFTGCNSTSCPRFNSSSNCIGESLRLNCIEGKVSRLCVLASDLALVFGFDFGQPPLPLFVQKFARFPTEWVDFLIDWTIDFTHFLVRSSAELWSMS